MEIGGVVGFYFRKSINVGPVRFNLSKSGLGVSTGVRGFRVGTGPRGNYVHMGRHGVYYRTSLGKLLNQNSAQNLELEDSSYHPNEFLTEDVIGSQIIPLAPTNSDDIVDQLNAAAQTSRWGRKQTVALFYDVNDASAQWFDALVQAWGWLTACNRLSQVVDRGDYVTLRQQKMNAGATGGVSRRTTQATVSGPPHLSTNIHVPALEMGETGLYFLPDRILIREGKWYNTLGYTDLTARHSTVEFIEDGSDRLPADAVVVGSTWRYLNKNGGPDGRFANNQKVPIVQYGVLQLESRQGKRWQFYTSQVQAAQYIAELLSPVVDDRTTRPQDSRPAEPIDIGALAKQIDSEELTSQILTEIHDWTPGVPVRSPFQVGDRVECRTAGELYDGIGTVRAASILLDVGGGTPTYPMFQVVLGDPQRPDLTDPQWYSEICLKWLPGRRNSVKFSLGDRVFCYSNEHVNEYSGTVVGISLMDHEQGWQYPVYYVLLDQREATGSDQSNAPWTSWPRRGYTEEKLTRIS
ncbi:DUF4236 domain-containing protein [Mycolicibacter longobardus]|uniref:DUF4236 domain-containing protein n=1 Tax=Mycolicibacter longobardus TaxID=1108812 RepID=UPI0010568181|nr:DUF4236 domain-containing protein [Mycolicibacter longobardus]MCV7383915.1 DUF4236 domain-containing protein [Mycolicibacter longobardus]